jgi:hypothetical protein
MAVQLVVMLLEVRWVVLRRIVMLVDVVVPVVLPTKFTLEESATIYMHASAGYHGYLFIHIIIILSSSLLCCRLLLLLLPFHW